MRAQPADVEPGDPVPGDAGGGRRVSRRSVLKAIGIGGGAVALAGATGVGIRGALNGVWSGGSGEPYELWWSWQDAPGLTALVAAGVLAANPHNLQAWRFAIDQDEIDLHADPDRIMPIGDADGRERMAGYGCAIQNMVLAARDRGLDADVDLRPDGPDRIARLRLTPGPGASERERQLAAVIAGRHSNRGPYADGPVPPDALAALGAGAPGGAEVHWVTETARRAELAALYVEATQAIVDDDETSMEAYSWFRSERADIDRHRDGLTLDCQGLDGLTLFAATILPPQSRTEGDAFWVNATRDVHTATAYGIIRVPDAADPAARIAGGRLLQHVHLAATADGLALQHMNQVTERIARDTATASPDLFTERWAEAIGIPTAEALVAFRIGHPERDAEPSPRRGLADVLLAGVACPATSGRSPMRSEAQHPPARRLSGMSPLARALDRGVVIDSPGPRTRMRLGRARRRHPRR